MKIYERIKEFDEEMMAEFLYRFAKDTLSQFEHFIMPDKDNILVFLDKDIPEED